MLDFQLILYPLTLLVTILHELGHACGALLTGGSVLSLKVAPNGSGLCTTMGGMALVVLPAGYLGSVVFGNLMLYLGVRRPKLSRLGLLVLGLVIMGVSFLWFGGLQSMIITFGWGFVLFMIAYKFPRIARVFFVLAGIYSVFYVLRDYAGGPSSDLNAFAGFTHVSASVWAYVWLGFALVITACNVFFFLRGKRK